MAYNMYPNYPANFFPQQNGGLIWVQGEAGAKSYLVAPNATVALWDSESQTVYLKSSDAAGMPTMKILDYKIRENTPSEAQNCDFSEFATKKDVDIIRKDIEALRACFTQHIGEEKSNE